MKSLPPRRLWLTQLIAILFGLLLIGTASQAAERKLTSIQTTELSQDKVEILLQFDQIAPKPEVVIKKGYVPRAIIKLPKTKLNFPANAKKITAGPAHSLRAKYRSGTTQLIFDTRQEVEWTASRNKKALRVILTSAGSEQAKKPTAQKAPHTQRQPSPDLASRVDFHRTETGAGQLTIKTKKITQPAEIEENNGQVIATLPGVVLPKKFEKRLNVTDFSTPVESIDIYRSRGNTKIVFSLQKGAEYKHQAFQSDNEFTLEVEPVAEKPSDKKQSQQADQQFAGEKISLSFQRINIRSVLQTIADIADINLVTSDNIHGDITLQLEDVPWDQAFNIILKTKGLGMRQSGNIIHVAPLEEIIKYERAEAEAAQASRSRAPIQSEIIQINYAEAEAIASLLKSQKDESALISKRGQVTVDKRTNSLLINETETQLETIRRIIAQLDQPVRQVQIEARIVVANRSFSKELGVGQTAKYNGSGGSSFDSGGYTVNVPVNSPAGELTTSILSNNFRLDLALSALETEERGEIISSPSIITTDGHEAVIRQGQEVPYVTEHGDRDSSTTEFKEVELNLTVKPHITPDNHILLDMDLTQDSVNRLSDEGEPVIDTRGITNQVLVANGNTVVLGGIYQHEQRNSERKVPILGDIPLLGRLFKGTDRANEKQELLVFITPKVLQQTLTDTLNDELELSLEN